GKSRTPSIPGSAWGRTAARLCLAEGSGTVLGREPPFEAEPRKQGAPRRSLGARTTGEKVGALGHGRQRPKSPTFPCLRGPSFLRGKDGHERTAAPRRVGGDGQKAVVPESERHVREPEAPGSVGEHGLPSEGHPHARIAAAFDGNGGELRLMAIAPGCGEGR